MIKKQVRKNVFETNSSSSHSLTLNTEDFSIDTSMVPVDGVVTINRPDGEFGWEWFKENDAYTKALYAIIDGCEGLVRQAIHKQLGAFLEITENSDTESWGYNNGYIDHDSHGNVSGEVKTIDDMISFIFNKNSWIFGGNDNGEAPDNFYITPFFDAKGDVRGNDCILTMNLFGKEISKEVPKSVNEKIIENIIYHASPENEDFIDEETGRGYGYYNSSIDCNKKQILFSTYYDKELDPHLIDASWEERRQEMKQYDKIITYDISER